MKLAMIGLGRMGMNMARRLLTGGHQVVAYNRTPDKTEQMMAEGAAGAFSLKEVTDISGHVDDSGEGRWTVVQAVETGVPAEVITLSLMRRLRSRLKDPFAERVLTALRREFGGHAVVSSN